MSRAAAAVVGVGIGVGSVTTTLARGEGPTSFVAASARLAASSLAGDSATGLGPGRASSTEGRAGGESVDTLRESFKDALEELRERALVIDKPVEARRIPDIILLRIEPFAGVGEEGREDEDTESALLGGEAMAVGAVITQIKGKSGRKSETVLLDREMVVVNSGVYIHERRLPDGELEVDCRPSSTGLFHEIANAIRLRKNYCTRGC